MEKKKIIRKPKYETEEELQEAKRIYNKRYYDKKTNQLKELHEYKSMIKIKNYSDDDLKNIIETVGWQRILNLMI